MGGLAETLGIVQAASAQVARGNGAEGIPLLIALRDESKDRTGSSSRATVAFSLLLGHALRSCKSLAEAAQEVQGAIDAYNEARSPHEPQLAASLHIARGEMYHAQRAFDAAQASYQNAIDVLAEAYGGDYPGAASPHVNLGLLHLEQGNFRASEKHFVRAQKMTRTVLGLPTAEEDACLAGLAALYQKQRRWKEALRCHEDRLRRFLKLYGPGRAECAPVHVDIAYCLLNLDRPAVAIAHLTRARSWAGSESLVRASCRLLACAYMALNQPQNAAATLRRILEHDLEAVAMFQALPVDVRRPSEPESVKRTV